MINPPGNTSVYWRLVLEIPPNILALADLEGDGHPCREDDGTWRLRHSCRAVANFSYGDATPAELYVAPEAGTLALVRVVIDQAFNGVGASIMVGDGVDPDRYIPASHIDPSMLASFEACPDRVIPAGAGVSITISPGSGATAGSGRLIVDLVPSAES